MAQIKLQGKTLIQGTTIFATDLTPTYTITRSASSVDEGSSITFTLSTTNVDNGTVLPYTITGISANDVTSGSLTGNFTVNSGTATTTITMSADRLTEGAETATITLNNGAASNFVVVNDTSVFTPNLISGLQLWLDASDSSTLYDAATGGSLVTTDGSAVARWQDKSGNNRHAIQGTINNRPTKNGSSLYFNGSTSFFDYLNGYSLNMGIGSSGTFVFMASGNGGSLISNERTGGNPGNGRVQIISNKIQCNVNSRTSPPFEYDLTSAASLNLNAMNFCAVSYVAPSTTGTLSGVLCVNGAFSTVTNSSYTVSNAVAYNTLEIGRYRNFTYFTNYFSGSISKILYYNRNLTQSEITSLYQSL